MKLFSRSNKHRGYGKLYKAFGEEHTLSEWARMYNINYARLYNRVVSDGWDIERALTEPVNSHKRLTAFGKTQSLTKWSKETGHIAPTIKRRIDRGMSVEDALSVDKMPRNLCKNSGRTHTAFGEEHNLTEWAEMYGLPKEVLEERMKRYGDIEIALSKPYQPRQNYNDLKEQCESLDIPYDWVRRKLQQGMTFEDAVHLWDDQPRHGRYGTLNKSNVPRMQRYGYNGKLQTVGEISTEYGIPRQTIYMWVEKGIPLDVAIPKYLAKHKKVGLQ